MSDINVGIPRKELTDKRLIAGHREIKSLPILIKKRKRFQFCNPHPLQTLVYYEKI